MPVLTRSKALALKNDTKDDTTDVDHIFETIAEIDVSIDGINASLDRIINYNSTLKNIYTRTRLNTPMLPAKPVLNNWENTDVDLTNNIMSIKYQQDQYENMIFNTVYALINVSLIVYVVLFCF
jgi:hypothetical protein